MNKRVEQGDRVGKIGASDSRPMTPTWWVLSPSFVRTARMVHHCASFHVVDDLTASEGFRRAWCQRPIAAGETYVEYKGESAAFQSGHRYHLDCARTVRVLVAGTQPLRHRQACRRSFLDRQRADPTTCDCGGELDTGYERVPGGRRPES